MNVRNSILMTVLIVLTLTGSSAAQYSQKWSTYIEGGNNYIEFVNDSQNPSSDYNGDSYPDIIVHQLSEMTVVKVIVISGLNGQVLWTLPSDTYVYGIGNSDNDSYPEVLALHFNSTTHTYDSILVLDGRTGSVEWSRSGQYTDPLFVDVDNDGLDEIIFMSGEYVICYEFGLATNVESTEDKDVPQSYSLEQNYPNPFNPSTYIEFSVPTRTFVKVEIYNTLGQMIRTLTAQELESGNHIIVWDGKNNFNQNVSTGVYFYRISTEDYSSTKKMVLLK